MPIRVACTCGKAFAAPDSLAGKRVKCPQCGSALAIPAAETAAAVAAPSRAPQDTRQQSAPAAPPRDLFAEAGIQQRAVGTNPCPGCGQAMPDQALLCVNCGYHRQLGRRLEGAKAGAPVGGGHGGHGVGVEEALRRAAQVIDEDKAEESKTRSQGLPAWAYALLLVGVGFLTYGIASIGPRTSFIYAAVTFFIAGALAKAYYSLMILVEAWDESPICFLLHAVPFYGIYYLITRWDRVGKYFMMTIYIGGIVDFPAGVLLGIAQLLVEDANKMESSLFPLERVGELIHWL